jgi:hypothetical protein
VFDGLVPRIPKIRYFLEDQGIHNEGNTTHQSTTFIVANVTTAPLICITKFTGTKYVHQLLASLQHVSAIHSCHHQGLLSVATVAPSK